MDNNDPKHLNSTPVAQNKKAQTASAAAVENVIISLAMLLGRVVARSDQADQTQPRLPEQTQEGGS